MVWVRLCAGRRARWQKSALAEECAGRIGRGTPWVGSSQTYIPTCNLSVLQFTLLPRTLLKPCLCLCYHCPVTRCKIKPDALVDHGRKAQAVCI
jgi:hypothetical protein